MRGRRWPPFPCPGKAKCGCTGTASSSHRSVTRPPTRRSTPWAGWGRPGSPKACTVQAARYVDGLVAAAEEEGRRVDPLRAIAEATGSGTVVSGSYYVFGDDVHIQVQITNPSTGATLDQIEPIIVPRGNPASGLGLLRTRVMGSLALNLDGRLEGHAAQSESPPDFEAYQAFSRGLDAYTRSDWEESVAYFVEARALDSTFALPLLYESFGRSNLVQVAEADSVVDLLATYAGQLSPFHRAWVRHLQAQFDLDRPEALDAIREAARMAPGSKASYNASWLAVINNRPREALEWLDQLEPERGPMRGWFHYWNNRADALHKLGEHEEELEIARQARQIYPRFAATQRIEASALIGLGRVDEAMQIVHGAPVHPGTDRDAGWVMGSIAFDFEAHGYPDEETETLEAALAWYEDQLAGNPSGDWRRVLYEGRQAMLHRLSRYDDAKEALDELFAEFGPRPNYLGRRAVLLAWLGEWEQARTEALALDTLDVPFTRPFYTMDQARVAAVTGDADAAVSLFARAIREGLAVPAHVDRDFQRIKDDPRLQDLLRPKG